MSRLVVVSNRVAPIDERKAQAGGLAVAVLAALKKDGGLWFGWSGEIGETSDEAPKLIQSGAVSFATFGLSERDYDEYYKGFANSTLWPLLHYRIDLMEFSRRTFAGYQRVNSQFAAKLATMLEPDDRIWVHDYHLIPFAEQLRHMGVGNAIGFFLHTPFPVPEVMAVLPAAEQLVRALCCYDVIGFQTRRDRHAFLSFLAEYGGAEMVDDKLVRAYGRLLRVESFPISIETDDIEKQAEAAARTQQSQRLLQSIRQRDLIIGVDRLDYSKGLPQRFEAFRYLLEHYAGIRSSVTFMQIAPASRSDVADYRDIRHELEGMAGAINGTYGDFDWTPLRYLNRGFARRALLGFYRISRVALVTPLRDGMNLVAKEYVASQDPKDPGVLVLSRFAGAAEEMEATLIVNPHDAEGVAESMQRALTMPLEERQERYQALIEILRHNDINRWRERYLEALDAAPYGP